MKRACFIIPYFGQLPNYFQLFLNSCKPNKEFDWILFTDDTTDFDFPENVKRIPMTWNEFKKNTQDKFKIKLSLNFIRKLCDFKPVYGYIFEDYITNYPYWGYCDIDTIMGNLDKLLPMSMLEKYDKLFSLGHMVLFRNSPEINRAFMLPIDNENIYKEALSTNDITVFDETGSGKKNIDTIFVKNGYKVFHADWSYNPRVIPTKFKNVIYDYSTDSFYDESLKNTVCIWNGKDIERYIFKNNGVITEEYLYMHLQQRKMKLAKGVIKAKAFAIIPNEFIPVDVTKLKDLKYIKKIKRHNVNLHYIRILWKWKVKNRFFKKN